MTDNVKNELESRGKKSIEHFKQELSRMRTGRASTSLLGGIIVEYYGSDVPLQQLGMVSAPEPRMLTVQVYDAGAVESIEKAIMQSDLGLNPSRDGNLIRVAIPVLTEERRRDLVKALHKMAEEAKIAVRSLRRDAIDELKKKEKDKEISEDQMRKGQDDLQKVTDSLVKEIDHLLQAKEQEMMEV
ncbi:MAG: ribosome recycling factor [Bdellovibrionales bacterium]|nr:ribosome recycling factor [Bdellovibrionales bacterium]